jgi:[ribosomal protein S18]-alanine N-acetyltransferase
MTSPALMLQAATLDDLPALFLLEVRCHSHPWSAPGLRDAIAPAVGTGAVLLLRAPCAPDDAYGGIRAYCAFHMVLDEVHVHNLAVVPEARRHGLGRRLLALTLEIAARKGARAAHLEVRAGNSAARALYRAMGFHEAGLRRAYYSAPVEDAVLLSRTDLASNLERPPPWC